MARADEGDLHGSIEEFIKDGLGSIEVASVEVDEDCEHDGFRVLDITIFVRGTPHEIARKEPSGFLSKLRAHVEDAYHAFPIVRFRSASLQGV